MTAPSGSVSRPPLDTPTPPRKRPGPPESGTISCAVVSTGVRRSWPSSGCTARPTPKTGEVQFGAVLAVAPAPAADHPVVPHEHGAIVGARVAPADQQVLEVEAARHRPVGHDLRPQLVDRRSSPSRSRRSRSRSPPPASGVDRPCSPRPRRPRSRGRSRSSAARRGRTSSCRRRCPRTSCRSSSSGTCATAGWEPGEVVAQLLAVDLELDLDRHEPLALGGVEVDVVLRLPGAVGQLARCACG